MLSSRYIYTQDDVEPARLRVTELCVAVTRLQKSGLTAQENPDSNDTTALYDSSSTENSTKNVQSRITDSSQEKPELSQGQNSNGFQDQNGPMYCSHEQSDLNVASDQSDLAQLPGSCEPTTAQLTGSVEMYCKLGQDLLHMYQTTLGSNVKVKVKDTTLQLHRCVVKQIMNGHL
jgi:hypothetical protein